MKKMSLIELAINPDYDSIYLGIGKDEIDWSDLWIIDFRHLHVGVIRDLWFVIEFFDQVPYLVRVLFARYGTYEGCKMFRKILYNPNTITKFYCVKGGIKVIRDESLNSSKFYKIPWIKGDEHEPFAYAPHWRWLFEAICMGRRIYRAY